MKSKLSDWKINSPEYLALKNNCDVIVQADLDSIKKPKLFNKDNDKFNDLLLMCLRNILEHSKIRTKYKYGETGYVIRLDYGIIFIPVDGDYNSVKLINGELVNHLLKMNLVSGCLICCHNHPNNSKFSLDDILNFLKYDIISTIVVVGNTNNVFILRKTFEKNMNYDFINLRRNLVFERIKLLNNHNKNYVDNILSDYILSNCDKLNLEFIHYIRG